MSVTAADVAWMQDSVSGLRPTACVIQRKSSAPDGMGGVTETWNSLTSTTCRVMRDNRMPVEVEEHERLENVVRWTLAFTAGTDITASDRIVALGMTYEVVGVFGPLTNELERLVLCVVLQ